MHRSSNNELLVKTADLEVLSSATGYVQVFRKPTQAIEGLGQRNHSTACKCSLELNNETVSLKDKGLLNSRSRRHKQTLVILVFLDNLILKQTI